MAYVYFQILMIIFGVFIYFAVAFVKLNVLGLIADIIEKIWNYFKYQFLEDVMNT